MAGCGAGDLLLSMRFRKLVAERFGRQAPSDDTAWGAARGVGAA